MAGGPNLEELRDTIRTVRQELRSIAVGTFGFDLRVAARVGSDALRGAIPEFGPNTTARVQAWVNLVAAATLILERAKHSRDDEVARSAIIEATGLLTSVLAGLEDRPREG